MKSKLSSYFLPQSDYISTYLCNFISLSSPNSLARDILSENTFSLCYKVHKTRKKTVNKNESQCCNQVRRSAKKFRKLYITSPISLSQYWKTVQIDSVPKFISHFGSTINLFVNCIKYSQFELKTQTIITYVIYSFLPDSLQRRECYLKYI